MTDDIQQTTEFVKPTPRLAGIIWGGPKSGKTTYACSSPGTKHIFNLDPEGWTAVGHRTDINVNDLSNLEPEQLIDYFVSKTGGTSAAALWLAKQNVQPGDTVLLDTMTVLNQAGIETAIKRRVGEGKGFTPSLEAPGLGAYGARTQYLTSAMGSVNRAARRLNAHIWFICHEDTPERNEKGEFLYQSILLSDKAINNSSGAISEIWRMTESDNDRTVMIRSTARYKPMGTRMFKAEDKKEFKLVYKIDKPDIEQPMAIVSLWNQYIAGNQAKINVPEPPAGRR